jgi:hypothetical protein
MTTRSRKFVKGIRLKSTTEAPALDGEISNKDNRLEAHLEGSVRKVVTEDQTQTLTNKSIDADTNTISNIETDNLKAGVLVTDISLASADTEIPSALAVKTALEAQNEASEIEFDPTVDINSTDVQGAIEDVQSNLQDHIDSLAAHDSANIDYDPTISGLTATKVKPAIDELDGRLDTAESSLSTAEGKVDDLITLSGVAANSEDLGTFTGTIIPDNTTVKPALQALETQSETTANSLGSHISATAAHGATGAVVGTTNVQILQFKTYQAANFTQMQSESSENNNQTGSEVTLTEPAQPIVRLTSSGLSSVAGIAQASYALNRVVTIFNTNFSAEIEILNNSSSASAENRISTGIDDDITLAPQSALFLKYDSTSQVWRVIGGTGGASTIVKGTAGEAMSEEFVCIDSSDGKIYKLDASNDDRIEYLGIAKGFALEDEPIKAITSGIIKGFIGLTPGLPVYADPTTPGGYTQTSPEDNIFNNKWVIRVGIAISATQILISPDQAASAYFKVDTSDSVTIANNQSVAANVPDLILDGSQIRSALIEYSLYRKTDTNEVLQSGSFRVQYKPIEMTWLLGAESYLGDNAGVTFSITSGGQVQYVSDDLTGTNYEGNLKYNVLQLFNA